MHSTKTICSDKNRLRAAINNLVSFSLVQRKTTSSSKDGSFWIHPLVHLWAREITSEGIPVAPGTTPVQSAFERAICIAGKGLQHIEYQKTQSDWDFDQSIETHFQILAKYLPELYNQETHTDEIDHRFAEALYKIGFVEFHWRRCDRSERFLRASISAYEQTADDPCRYEAMRALARVLVDKAGHGPEGLELAQRALKGIESLEENRRVNAEKRDIHRVEFMRTTGILMRTNGKYNEVIQLYNEAISLAEETLGPEHFITLRMVNSLAVTLGTQGHYCKAIELYTRTLHVYSRILASGHISINRNHYNLGLCYMKGDHQKAQRHAFLALEGYEKTLGMHNTATLDAVSLVGYTYYNLGDYENALNYYRRSLEGYEKTLGTDHTKTLNTVHWIGNTYCNSGDYENALNYYRRSLEGYEKTLGTDHTETLNTVRCIGNTYYNSGDYENALTYYRRSLEGYEKTLGTDHTETLNTVSCIGNTYYNSGDYENALTYYRRLLEGRKKTLGTDHADTLEAAQDIRDAERYITTIESSAASQISSI